MDDKNFNVENGPIFPLLSRRFRSFENWMAQYCRVEEYEIFETDIWRRELLQSDSSDVRDPLWMSAFFVPRREGAKCRGFCTAWHSLWRPAWRAR